jgi:spore germination protein YaaH
MRIFTHNIFCSWTQRLVLAQQFIINFKTDFFKMLHFDASISISIQNNFNASSNNENNAKKIKNIIFF